MLYLEQGELPVDEQKARKIVLTSEFYTLLNGKLHHLYQPTHSRIKVLKPVVHQLCIPQAMRQEVVDGYHAENAYIGFERLYDTVRQKYYWPRLYTDLYEVVTGCRDCQQSKVSTKAKRAPLCPLPVASVFERVHIDLLGPLPESPEGFKYILVIVESLSRFPEIFCVENAEIRGDCRASLFCILQMGGSSQHSQRFREKLDFTSHQESMFSLQNQASQDVIIPSAEQRSVRGFQ